MVLPASSGPRRSATNFFWNSPSALPKAGLVPTSTAARVAVGPAAHRGLRDHAAHGMTDEHGPIEAPPLD